MALINHEIDDFNPRSPRGGATKIQVAAGYQTSISIHAPHEGERPIRQKQPPQGMHFNPRSPRGGATSRWHKNLRGGANFNPRSPRGGATRFRRNVQPRIMHFNPRSPRGGATHAAQGEHIITIISIHAPHEGERLRDKCRGGIPCRISIHAPHEGERQADLAHDARRKRISIHAPHEGERL